MPFFVVACVAVGYVRRSTGMRNQPLEGDGGPDATRPAKRPKTMNEPRSILRPAADRSAPAGRSRPRAAWRHAAVVLLLAVLALWDVYPLWLDPTGRVEDPGDPLLNGWILKWDLRALFHDPLHFFDANVFWPNPAALAFGEHLITETALLLPFAWLTDHAAALHTISLLEAYFLSAVGAYLLGLHYFRRVGPATVCALAYGFALYRLNQRTHLQLIHGEFLPLIVLAFEKTLQGGRRRWALALGAACLGQWLTSWYWTVFSLGCAGPYMAVRLWQARRGLACPPKRQRRRAARRLALVVAPIVLAAACAAAVAVPYWRLARVGLLPPRAPATGAMFAARPADFAVAPRRSLVYGGLARGEPLERALFPGLALLAGFVFTLADLAIARRRGRAEAGPFPRGLWLAISILLLSFTFGDSAILPTASRPIAVPLPLALLSWIPGADQMRAPARWMLPALLGLALLTADGWGRLAGSKRAAARRGAGLCMAWLILECLARPAARVAVPARIPPALQYLNEQPGPSPILLLPTFYYRMMNEASWLRQPIMNGYNGYMPPGHMAALGRLADAFPDAWAVDRLRQLGVRFVVVNLDEAAGPPRAAGGEAISSWDATRLARLPQGLAARTLGNYVVIDLGRAETDRGLNRNSYDELTK